jgi:hypothetical protein
MEAISGIIEILVIKAFNLFSLLRSLSRLILSANEVCEK